MLKQVTVATRQPRGDDLGSVEIGFYTVDGDTITMCSEEGVPLRNSSGNPIAHKLVSGENEKVIAGRLRLKMWRDVNDDDANDFNRRISYPPIGIV